MVTADQLLCHGFGDYVLQLIIADNAMHVAINAAALRWL